MTLPRRRGNDPTASLEDHFDPVIPKIQSGSGRHRWVGAAFAMMQVKAISPTLLPGWESVLPPEPPDELRSAVELAVEYRLTHALSIIETEED